MSSTLCWVPVKPVEQEYLIDALEEAGKYDKAQFVIRMIHFQRTMPLWERVKLATSILFVKYWWAVNKIVLFWNKEKS